MICYVDLRALKQKPHCWFLFLKNVSSCRTKQTDWHLGTGLLTMARSWPAWSHSLRLLSSTLISDAAGDQTSLHPLSTGHRALRRSRQPFTHRQQKNGGNFLKFFSGWNSVTEKTAQVRDNKVWVHNMKLLFGFLVRAYLDSFISCTNDQINFNCLCVIQIFFGKML